MSHPPLGEETLLREKVHFWRHGYVHVPGVFTADEMAVVRRRVMAVPEMNARVEHVRGRQALGEHPSFETIFVWNDVTADDLFAKVGRSYKLLDRLSSYFEDDVYGYHNKIALKEPGVVGFRPHQDHAYWQHYGCRLPEAHAAFIAIDDATRDNGCLAVVPDSHLLGTLPHTAWTERGSDHGVEPAALDALWALGYRLEPIEMASGDVLLFHGNTIHGSADNHSDRPRLAMIATMNTRRNSPDPAKNRSGHPYWSQQARVFDAIVEADLARPLPNFTLRY
ncbi:MAG: phytanoyl-CoA dioxygenase family protein [bacterium]